MRTGHAPEGAGDVSRIRSYCVLCQSLCPIVCHVETGRFTGVSPDREHPHATPLCPKGLAGPELVYDAQRLRYPLRRTRPKGDHDPGWERISWDEAMGTVAQRLTQLRQDHGAHAVVFNRPGPGGSPAKDYAEWVVRLAHAFGSPNTLATGHVCQWHRDTGSKYTYGDEAVPEADYANTALLLIWGHNPYTSVRCNVRDINRARRNGAKLVVIDPRRTEIAQTADLWLQLRPGTDGALILGLIRLLLETRSFDEPFVRAWTNAPFLVRSDTGDLLASDDVEMASRAPGFVVWDATRGAPALAPPPGATGDGTVTPGMEGAFQVPLRGGGDIEAQPVLEHLRHLTASYTPERVESITGVPPEKLHALAHDLGTIRPASYYSYNGLEQHTNAMQTNRALCVLYALTGSLDRPGGNVYFPKIPASKMRGPALLPPEVHRLRIGHRERPLGPAGRPNSSAQAYRVFEAILTDHPYPVKGLVAFGGNIVTANAHSLRAREALSQLDFFVQTELFLTPSAELADIVLPAATFYEASHLRLGFPNLWDARQWIQYRPQVVPPLHETRPDVEIILDLACRLGLGDRFWHGDLDEAFESQLRPLGLRLDQVKENPGGMPVDLSLSHEKYRRPKPDTGLPRGFKTPSGRVEVYSQLFKEHGYDPLPVYREPEVGPVTQAHLAERYPLVLTCSKLLPFCHGQHRSLPSLRKRIPEPFAEIHPVTAQERGVADGDWVHVETPEGRIRLVARVTDAIGPGTICVQHGWWQPCPELGLPGYPPFAPDGANANMLYATRATDPISGSVPYKAYLCQVAKA